MKKTAITVLQELLVQHSDIARYECVAQSGPHHRTVFEYSCSARGQVVSGTARSKKDAKQEAARLMLRRLAAAGMAVPPPYNAPGPDPPGARVGNGAAPSDIRSYKALLKLKMKKTAITVLQELLVQHSDIARYECVAQSGPHHRTVFEYSCSARGQVVSGTARSKKDAKQEAARLMLRRLAAAGMAVPPPYNAPGPDPPGARVGNGAAPSDIRSYKALLKLKMKKTAITVLQELLVQHSDIARYECVAQSGPHHRAVFEYSCSARGQVVSGTARSKKDAKQEAARLMLRRLAAAGMAVPPPYNAPGPDPPGARVGNGAAPSDIRSYKALLKLKMKKTAITVLQELLVQHSDIARYECVAQSGPHHRTVFEYSCSARGQVVSGTARSKKDAKQEAARLMLRRLAAAGMAVPPPYNAPGPDPPGARVGNGAAPSDIRSYKALLKLKMKKTAITVLQELLVQHSDIARYECVAQSGPHHRTVFEYSCSARGQVVSGTARSKKDAKQEAARLMLRRLAAAGMAVPPPYNAPGPDPPGARVGNGAAPSDIRSYKALLKLKMKKTAITVLQELLVQHSDIARYECVAQSGPHHRTVFEYSCSARGQVVSGTARSKKDAKQEAARLMLRRLAAAGMAVPPPYNAPGPDPPGARVGNGAAPSDIRSYKALLKNLCQKYKLPGPFYTLEGDTGPAHARTFTARCAVGAHERLASAARKKAAQQLAAQQLYLYFVEEKAREDAAGRPNMAQRVSDGFTEEQQINLGAEALDAATPELDPEKMLTALAGALGVAERWLELPAQNGALMLLRLVPTSPPFVFCARSRADAAAAALSYLW